MIFKWGRGVFTEPFPKHVKWLLGVGVVVLVLYPAVKVRGLLFLTFLMNGY